MQSLSRYMRQFILIIVLIGTFVAGSVLDPFGIADADDSQQQNPPGGLSNQVLQVSTIATPDNPLVIYEQPSTESPVMINLLWGDRVLWMQEEQIDDSGNRWIRVSIAEGLTGWTIWNITDPVPQLVGWRAIYTTPGADVGKTIQITNDGSGANFRENPGVQAPRIRKVQPGDTMTIIGGPYQTQYFIWWQLEDASGTQGWLVDVQGWFEIVE